MDLQSFELQTTTTMERHEGSVIESNEAEVEAILSLAGINKESISGETKARLLLMKENSKFVSDDKKMLALAEFFFDSMAKRGEPFSDLEKRVVRYGIVLSDVGKTGPLDALPKDQMNILSMYCVENVPTESMTLEDFLHTYLPEKYESCKQTLLQIGFGSLNESTMHDFWNSHGIWTRDIIKNDKNIPKELMPGAICHHILEHVNESVVEELGKLKEDFGENTKFDRAEILVILIDKYNALINRLKLTHQRAMEVLGQIVARSSYANAKAFSDLMGVIDELGNSQK